MDELKAKLRLTDGRQVWRDGRGRYRDAETGRFLPREQVEALLPPQDIGTASAQARRQLLAAVRALGLEADTAEEAWGKLVEVQAELALDKGQGGKATTAARFVGQVTGLAEEQEEARETDHLVLGRELAVEVLRLIEDGEES